MSLKERLSNVDLEQLFAAILSLKNQEECDAFFEDICTLSEVKAMSQRLEVAKMLNKGENYNNIAKATGASSTTVSRVNRCLHYGAGGYVRVMQVINKGVTRK
ncbi:MAG: YerC/YecD family TrpR-related protein [Acidaminococcaceae bacterium]|nr:YerC/YecD family TrpR-related protein [Acidaminococcaceae bacterium]